jgi:gliding motility-associated-like protein
MNIWNQIAGILLLIIGFNVRSLSQVIPPPVIRYVTVDTLTGNVLIRWDNKSPAGVQNYVVYEGRAGSEPLVADPIDTLDASVTSYIHVTASTALRPLPYTVASIYADDTSPLAEYHYTIHTSVKFDSCRNSLIIDWTPYIGWKDKLMAYNVYIRSGTGEVIKIPSLSSGIQSYTFSSVNPYTLYRIFVEAENRDFFTSLSNQVIITTNRADPPSYINADFATVTGDRQISLSFSFDEASQVHDFVLYFGLSKDKITQKIAEFNNVLSGPITYTYEVFSVKRSKNYFQLMAVDECPQKNPLQRSNIASNIILDAELDENAGNEKIADLQWDDYQEWIAGVKTYNVYRITDGTNVQKIDSFSSGISTLSDNLTFLRNGQETVSDKVCYYIEAEENDDNIHGIKGSSRSNVICISLEPDIYMANAFTPDGNGHNDRIRPVLTYRPDEYYFAVYDRWNSKIFETTDPDEYWNGEINGKRKAPPGVYIYYLKLTTSGNIIKEKKGTITVFYP